MLREDRPMHLLDISRARDDADPDDGGE